MKKLFGQKSFLLGFSLTFVAFFIANVWSAMANRYSPNGAIKICFDCYETYGFPFVMHESGTILHLDQYIWSGVIANLTVAALGAMFTGWLFSLIARSLFGRKSSLR